MPSIAELILLSLLFLDILTVIAIMIVERKDPYKVLAWSVIVIILPIIGSLGYLLIGQRNLLYGMYAEKRSVTCNLKPKTSPLPCSATSPTTIPPVSTSAKTP